MTSFNIASCSVGRPCDPVFIIAEIGQNHQGDLNIAKRLIEEAKKIGCNSVKFQKTHFMGKFTKSSLDKQYTGPNSWGSTYGEHKHFLEFSIGEFKQLQNYCQTIGIHFSASAMDEISLMQLYSLNVPFIKIGSGDANNYPLLKISAQQKSPLIISTGMQTAATIAKVNSIMRNAKKENYSLLHCVSSYPTRMDDCNLLSIRLLRKKFPDVVVGYSGHEMASHTTQVAVLLGAKIIERHITLSKSQKGSDHLCSLTPSEFYNLVRAIRAFEKISLVDKPRTPTFVVRYFNGDEEVHKCLREVLEKDILVCERICRDKLSKSLVTSNFIKNGQQLTLNDIVVKVSEPPGIPAEYLDQCIGKIVLYDLDEDVPFQHRHISESQLSYLGL